MRRGQSLSRKMQCGHGFEGGGGEGTGHIKRGPGIRSSKGKAMTPGIRGTFQEKFEYWARTRGGR